MPICQVATLDGSSSLLYPPAGKVTTQGRKRRELAAGTGSCLAFVPCSTFTANTHSSSSDGPNSKYKTKPKKGSWGESHQLISRISLMVLAPFLPSCLSCGFPLLRGLWLAQRPLISEPDPFNRQKPEVTRHSQTGAELTLAPSLFSNRKSPLLCNFKCYYF